MQPNHSPPSAERSPHEHSSPEANATRGVWLVYAALLLVGGFLAGWLSVPLRYDQGSWWSNARVWLIATPFVLAAALYLVRFITGRWVRRSMQFSIITSLAVHLLLLMAVMEVVVFRHAWLDPQVARQLHNEPVVVPQYHASQLDSQRRANQDFQQPVETAPAEQPPEERERQSPTQETPPELQSRPTPTERPPEVRVIEKQAATKTAPRLSDRRSLTSRSNQRVERPQPKAAEAPQVAEEKSLRPVASPQDIQRPVVAASPVAPRQRVAHSLQSVPDRNAPLQRRAAAADAPSRPAAEAKKSISRTSVSKSPEAPTAAAPALREVAEMRPSPAPRQTSVRHTESSVNLQPRGLAASQNVGAATRSLARNRREASASISSSAQLSRRASLSTTHIAPAAVVRAPATSVARSGAASADAADALTPATTSRRHANAAGAAPQEVREVALAGRGPSSLTLAAVSSLSAGAPRRNAANAAPTLADVAGSANRERRRPVFSGGVLASAGIATGVPPIATGEAPADTPPANNSANTLRAADNLPGGLRGRGERAAASANIDGLLEMAQAREGNRGGPAARGMRRATSAKQRASLGDVASLESAAIAPGDVTRRRPATLQGRPSTGVAASEMADEAVASRRASQQLENNTVDGLPNNSPARRSAPTGAVIARRAMQAGPGGLGREAALDAGLPFRRTRQDRVTLATEASRFPRRGSRASANLDSSVVTAAEAFSARSRRLQGGLKAEGGGPLSPETEAAIERGLAFLARRQGPDGRWSLAHSADRRSERPVLASDTAATALALLSFQGAGYHHKDHKYRLVVGQALDFLLKNQKPNGDLFIAENELSNRSVWLYSHGIAALALCEAYGMTQDPQLRDPAQRALHFIAQSQQADLGGWRYSPGQGADTSVTGWMMMALKSGQLAGLETPPGVFEKIKKWLDAAQASPTEPYRYRYNPQAPDTPEQRHGRQPTPSMTAVGLLMRFYTGWRRDDENMIAGAQQLLNTPPEIGVRSNPKRDTYYWYYATQVMFHMGGDTWKAWNDKLHPLLMNSQATSGSLSGSWDPRRPTPDRWGPHGGRLYVTTMNLLSLEVRYRHLPLYEATAP